VLLHPHFTNIKAESKLMDDGAFQFRQYRLTMTLSADARSFQSSLVPTDECKEAWFSDQNGAIYTGRALGC
jgi:hypothetical protein